MKKNRYTKIFVSSVMLIFLMIFPNCSVNAQLLSVPSFSKDAVRERKIEKSAASKDIKSVEGTIIDFDKLLARASDKYFGDSEEHLKEFETPYNTIKTGIDNIEKNDPKWKTEEYEAKLNEYTKRRSEIMVVYEKENVIREVIKSLEVKAKEEADDYLKFGYDYRCSGLSGAITHYYSIKCPCADNFYNFYVNKVKVKEARKELKELLAAKPDYFEKSSMSYKLTFLKRDYLDNFDLWKKNEITSINNFISEVTSDYKEKEFHILGVLKFQKRKMETFIEMDESSDPVYAETIKKINETITLVEAGHKKNNFITPERTGKIIFTKTDAKQQEFETVEKTNTWNIDEQLYFRWFLEKTPAEYHTALAATEDNVYAYRDACDKHVIYINGEKFHESWFQSYGDISELYMNALTLRGKYDYASSFYKDFLIIALSKLKPGTYEMKIETYLGNQAGIGEASRTYTASPVATGTLTLNITAAAIAKLRANPEICHPAAGMSNPDLQSQMLTLFKAKGWKEIPKKVVILDKEWYIQRNKHTGIILGRSIRAMILSENGTECIRQEFEFEQPSKGGGAYGALQLNGVGDQNVVPCTCIK